MSPGRVILTEVARVLCPGRRGNRSGPLSRPGSGGKPQSRRQCHQTHAVDDSGQRARSACASRFSAGTKPKLGDSAAADRWTWLVLARHAQLRLGRTLGSKNERPATRYDVGRVLATGESYTPPHPHKKGTKPRRTTDDGRDHGTNYTAVS